MEDRLTARHGGDGPPEEATLPGRRILLGVTGSIAAYKAAELVRLCKRAGAEVQVLMTPDATRFIPALTLGTLSEREVLIELFPDNVQGSWTQHVHLGIWADLFVVAPATATTIAKLATGICDSMLTATALSRRCPMLVCPAMDHYMYRHPATQRNLETLRADGVDILEPEFGELASGLVGEGRMPEPAAIFLEIRQRALRGPGSDSLAGKKVLITAGPTREPLDPVRFLSNPSTGTMGFELARRAAERGAEVVLVTGPTELPTPARVRRVDVTTAAEMHRAALEHASADIVLAAAAVSDYAPAEPATQKIKKGEEELVLRLRRTPDVVAAIARQKRPAQVVVGFALETQDLIANARKKLEEKNLDWVVANPAAREGAGFGRQDNTITLLARDGRVLELGRLPKSLAAAKILDEVTRAAVPVEPARA